MDNATMSMNAAVGRAKELLDSGAVAWQPVYADVRVNGNKVGHIVSDGYSQTQWTFFPSDSTRRKRECKGVAEPRETLPAWCRESATFDAFKTYSEIWRKDGATGHER